MVDLVFLEIGQDKQLTIILYSRICKLPINTCMTDVGQSITHETTFRVRIIFGGNW